MAIEIRRDVAATPEEILAAIRDNTREWRESHVPAEVRAIGVLQVESRIRGTRFKLFYRRKWDGGDGSVDPIAVRGAVMRRTDHYSRVEARCGRDAGLLLASVLLVGVAGWIWVAGGSGAGVLLGVVTLMIIWTILVERPAALRANPEARYLIERLEEAIRAAEQSRTPPP